MPVENQIITLSVVKIAIKFSPCNTGRRYWKLGGSATEEHGLGRQGSWTDNFLEAKQENCEDWNVRNGKCELTKGEGYM